MFYTFMCSIHTLYMTLHVLYDSTRSIRLYMFYTTLYVLYTRYVRLCMFYTTLQV
jgi:hypothetical protein